MLSQYLIESDFELYFVEADIDMVRYFEKHFAPLSDRLIFEDFLKLDLKTVFGVRSFAVIGNFPYNISSQIIFKCLDHNEQIPEIVGMFQLEVAQRILATKGSKEYGIISVMTQLYYSGTEILRLEPEDFEPAPRVRSAVIRLKKRTRDTTPTDINLFRRIVKTSFGQRRKMLRKTLKAIVSQGIDPQDPFFQQRPEQLSVEDFIYLTKRIKKILDRK